MRGPTSQGPALAWHWPSAGFGVLAGLPAALATVFDPAVGLALAVGVLPAALVGLLPTRRLRAAYPLLGLSFGALMTIGATLASAPVLAVGAIVVLGAGGAWFAGRVPAGRVVLTLGLPIVAIGLSFDAVADAAAAGALMVGGSLYVWAVSLLVPERSSLVRQPTEHEPDEDRDVRTRPLAAAPSVGYGLRLGLAGATAAAIGFALDLDHRGWATAATLFVMRPEREMLRLRGLGRTASVAVGATVAVVVVRLDPADAAYGVVVLLSLAGLAGTRRSRWYVSPAFTTCLVLLLLLYAEPDAAGSRFGERVGETVLGVALAYLFGLALPAAAERWRAQRT